MSTFIKNKRKEAGLSQLAVAEVLGISRPTYVNLENGISKLTDKQKIVLSQLFKEEISEKDLVNTTEDINGGDVVMREIPKENIKKFKEVLIYIINKVGSRPNIGQTALYKLLYFSKRTII